MASDADWLEDVRRWYFAGQRNAASQLSPVGDVTPVEDGDALGYEAAHPALQAQNWPDSPSGLKA